MFLTISCMSVELACSEWKLLFRLDGGHRPRERSSSRTPSQDPNKADIRILGHLLACRLSVRQTQFTCIRVRMILYFRLPCLKNQQLSHTRASHRVCDWVTPHESVRKCQSQAQNQDPKLRRLARVARVDEPAQSIRLNERCTGLLL